MSPMKTTLRLPDGLADHAKSYANGLGITLNALCAVALRDYLDNRAAQSAGVQTVPPQSGAALPAGAPGAVAAVSTAAGGIKAPPAAASFKRRMRPNDRCHCGSGKKFKVCHGVKP